jgi:hypothetical protein
MALGAAAAVAVALGLKAAAMGLMAAGIYLLFVQLHGYQHDTNAELFRFPVEEHIHIHEDMEIQNATTSPRNSL